VALTSHKSCCVERKVQVKKTGGEQPAKSSLLFFCKYYFLIRDDILEQFCRADSLAEEDDKRLIICSAALRKRSLLSPF